MSFFKHRCAKRGGFGNRIFVARKAPWQEGCKTHGCDRPMPLTKTMVVGKYGRCSCDVRFEVLYGMAWLVDAP